MFTMQRELQVSAYGIDPGSLSVDERVAYIKEMVLALTDELHEVLGEVSWKSWTHGERYVNDEGVKKELVDAFHIFMNLALSVNMTPDELYSMYVKKRQVNVDRQRNDYDGQSTKCPNCSRALEDVSLHEIKLVDSAKTDVVLCGSCHSPIPLETARYFLSD